MSTFKASIAWRLTLWFLLLSFLPFGVMAVFVRRTVADEFVDLVSQDARAQARLLAATVPHLNGTDAVQSLLTVNSNEGRLLFVIDRKGRYVAYPGSEGTGRSARSDFSPEVVERLLGGGDGTIRERGSGRLIAYSAMPDGETIAVAATDGSVVSTEISQIEKDASVQLAVSMVILSIIGGAAIWIVVDPIRQLTKAAKAVGAGNLAVEVDSSDMEGEFETLTFAFNQMTSQLRESYAHLEQRVADRTMELATLNAVAEVVSGSLDLEEILCNALEKTLDALDFPTGAIYLADFQVGDLHMACHRGMSEEFQRVVAKGLISARVAESGRPVIIHDLADDPSAPHAVVAEGYRSVASIPLISKGRTEGVLTIASRRVHRFRQQDVELLLAIGHQIGVAMENARLFNGEQRRAEQFRVIGEVGRRITSILEVDELLDQMVKLIQESLGYYLVEISLVEGDVAVCKARAGGANADSAIQVLRLRLGDQSIIGWVAHTGEPLLVPDVSQEPRFLQGASTRTLSELALPIKVKDKVAGVLNIESERLHAFDESDLVVLQSLADQAAIAIDNVRLYQQAQQAAVVEERQRLARDLHDSVTQALYAVTLYAEAAARLVSNGQYALAANHLSEVRDLARQALGEMRLLIFELRPSLLEKEGLVGALRARLELVENRAGLATKFDVATEDRLPPVVESGLYYVAQEALNNVLKHAQARSVTMSLQQDQRTVSLEITDDGIGFDPTSVRDKAGLGLPGMGERAARLGGTLRVRSSPGEGTSIRLEVAL